VEEKNKKELKVASLLLGKKRQKKTRDEKDRENITD
jgi:hypothetical protein